MTDSTTGTTATADTTTTATTATTDSTTATAPVTGEVQGDASTTTATTDASTTDKATTAAPVVPAEYAAFKLPEGYVLEGERLDTLKAFAKTNNWTQEQAQAAVDKHIEMSEQGVAMAREAKVTVWTEQSKQQFGEKFDAISTDAKAGVAWAMKERPNMLQTFDDEGWGSNPDALWVFAKLGALTRGSKMEGLGGDTATGSPRDVGRTLYDHPSSQPKT